MPILGASSSGAKPAPTVPTSVSASDSGSGRAFNNGAASVSFTAPSTSKLPITSYTVTSSPGSYTASGASSPLTVTGLQSNTAYTYTVTATSAAGTSSASSASASVTATTVPQAPTIGTFTDGGTGTSGTLSFTLNATGGSAITNVTYSTDGTNYTSAGTTTSPITISGLTAGSYTFYVKAVNANGTSTASSGVAGTVLTPTAFDSIATQTLATNSTSVTFSSIPGTYKSLQIRAIGRDTLSVVGGGAYVAVQFNGDTASNYSYHYLKGDSTAGAGAGGSSSQTASQIYFPFTNSGNSNTLIYGAFIANIHDYASTSKTKTLRAFGGYDSNGTLASAPNVISLTSCAWYSTAAITSITLTKGSSNFAAGTTFALYGVK